MISTWTKLEVLSSESLHCDRCEVGISEAYAYLWVDYTFTAAVFCLPCALAQGYDPETVPKEEE